jgi:4'-phosphopantetheinyl transferase
VWVLDLSDPGWDVDAAAGVLAPGERRRAERGAPSVRRRRVLVRAALRSVLGVLVGTPPGRVPLDTVDGRPVLAGAVAARGLSLSCSAGGDVALVAVASGTGIGVDVEPTRDEDLELAVGEGWLAPAERAAVERLPAAGRPAALTRAWTQKEAVLKAEGSGLRRHPGTVVTPGTDGGRVGRWWVASVPVPVGHEASLATGTRLRRPAAVRRLSPGTLAGTSA